MTSKLGLHVIGTAFDPARLGQPAVVKLLDPTVDYVRQVRRAVGPDTLLVIRFYSSDQPFDEPELRADMWAADHASEIQAMTLGDPNVAFEGYNEVGYDEPTAQLYARFECRLLHHLHQLGARAVAGNWGVTWPTPELWSIYQPVLAALLPTDFVGLHEYWPDERVIDARWSNRFPTDRPVVITECGRDLVYGLGAKGWRFTCNTERFLLDLAKYDALLHTRPNVVGACVFQSGSQDPQWSGFEVNDIWHRVVNEEIKVEVPELARFMIQADPRMLVVTMTYDEHIARNERPAWDVAGMDRAVVVAPWDGWIEFTTDEDDPRGRGLSAAVVEAVSSLPNGWLREANPCHMSEMWVKAGDRVVRGQPLGKTGWTGYVEPPGPPGQHVHLVLYENSPSMLAFRYADASKVKLVWV
jgi:hypothetical protein